MANRCPTPAVVFGNLTPTTVTNPAQNAEALSILDTALTLPITALNDASLGYWNGILADTGAVNAYAAAVNFGTPSAYQVGMVVSFLAANTSTAANPTLNVNALGAKTILNPGGNALTGGEILSGMVTHVFYDGTNFRLMWCPIMNDFGSATGVQTLNCSGANSVYCSIANTDSSPTIHLTNLAYGTPVLIRYNNTTGVANQFFMDAYDPAGNIYNAFVYIAGQLIRPNLAGLNGGNGIVIQGGHQFLAYGMAWYSGGTNEMDLIGRLT